MKKIVKTPNKTETLRLLSHAVFALEATKGHLAWKVTDLVRKSGFSRALIYRYMGHSKQEMLSAVIKTFLGSFYGVDQPDPEATFAEQIMRARAEMRENPEAVLFYHRWRSKPSDLQKEFIAIEKRFERRLKKAYPSLTDAEILGRHVVIHGLVAAPFLTPEQARDLCQDFFKK